MAHTQVLGKALVGVPRKAYYLHTKVGRYQPKASEMFDFTFERTLQSVNESLQRLGVDYIDTVQGELHRMRDCWRGLRREP